MSGGYFKITLDRERTIDFQPQYVAKVEQSLGLRPDQFHKSSEWGKNELLAALWAGLMAENPDMPFEIVKEIWGAPAFTSQSDADNYSRQIAWSTKEEIRRSGLSKG